MSHAQRPLLGIGLAMASLLLFVMLDVTTKHLSTRFPVPLLVWARYTVHLLLMLVMLGPALRTRLFRTRRPGMHLVRGLLLLSTSQMCIRDRVVGLVHLEGEAGRGLEGLAAHGRDDLVGVGGLGLFDGLGPQDVYKRQWR